MEKTYDLKRASDNLIESKKLAKNLRDGINELLQKHGSVYSKNASIQEMQFGNAIDELLNFTSELSDFKDDADPEMNFRFQRILQYARGLAVDLDSFYINKDDKRIISSFLRMLNKANTQLILILEGRKEPETDLTPGIASSIDDIKNEYPGSSQYENAPISQSIDLPVNDVTQSKTLALALRNNIDNLLQKYSSWYSLTQSSLETEFGNAIGELLDLTKELLSYPGNSSTELNKHFQNALEKVQITAENLLKWYNKQEDQEIVKEFLDTIISTSDKVKIILEGKELPGITRTYFPNEGNNAEKGKEPEHKNIDLTTLRGRLLSDQSTETDLLEFSVYSTAIAQLIKTNVDEKKEIPVTPGTSSNQAGQKPRAAKPEDKSGRPFNIGIIAPWGHGKTTLMKSIQRELDPGYKFHDQDKEVEMKHNDQSASSKTTTYGRVMEYVHGIGLSQKENISQNFPTVWFNAWRYQSSEQIWAGVGHAIITQLSSRLSVVEQEKFWFKLQLKRVNILKMRKEFYSDLIKKLLPGLFTVIVASAIAVTAFVTNVNWKIPGIISFAGAAFTALHYYKISKEKIDGKVSVYFNEPDYSSKLGVYHEIIYDLHKVFSLVLKEDQRAVIFIDDLDRCSPTVIGEVFEAVNLMMVDPIIGRHCYFIFGMDAQVVAAALDNKYALMSGKLKQQEEAFGSVGWYFLDKFIQLPFNVPIMSREERLNFLEHYLNPDKLPVNNFQQSEDDLKNKAKEEVKNVMQEKDADKKQEQLKRVLNNPALKGEVKKEAVKEAIKEKLKDEDSSAIIEQLNFISPFLSSSPREIIRYINLLRFFNSTLFIRQSMGKTEPVEFKGVAKYLLIALKWPQLVRWIQWEGEDDLVLYNTTTDKARFLDEITRTFTETQNVLLADYYRIRESEKEQKTELQLLTEKLYDQWSLHIDLKIKISKDSTDKTGKKLPWLYDKQIMEVLMHKDIAGSTFEKALLSKIW